MSASLYDVLMTTVKLTRETQKDLDTNIQGAHPICDEFAYELYTWKSSGTYLEAENDTID